MNENPILCTECARPATPGGLIMVTATPLPIRTGLDDAIRATALKLVVMAHDDMSHTRENVVCGKACAMARLSRELDELMGIGPAASMAPSRLRYHVCPKIKNECAKAYLRQEVHDGITLDVACCGDGYKPIHALERCPAIGHGVECVKEGE